MGLAVVGSMMVGSATACVLVLELLGALSSRWGSASGLVWHMALVVIVGGEGVSASVFGAGLGLEVMGSMMMGSATACVSVLEPIWHMASVVIVGGEGVSASVFGAGGEGTNSVAARSDVAFLQEDSVSSSVVSSAEALRDKSSTVVPTEGSRLLLRKFSCALSVAARAMI